MELTVGNATMVLNIFKEITNHSADFNFKTNYKIVKLINSIETQLSPFQTALRQTLEQYGSFDNNLKFTPSTGHEPEVEKIVTEFYQEKVNIDDIKFSVNELENSNLSIDKISIIINFIE